MDMYNRTFVFSLTQMNEKKKIEGQNASFGTVFVNGVAKTYTDIVLTMDKVKYADARKLISGDIRKIRYITPAD